MHWRWQGPFEGLEECRTLGGGDECEEKLEIQDGKGDGSVQHSRKTNKAATVTKHAGQRKDKEQVREECPGLPSTQTGMPVTDHPEPPALPASNTPPPAPPEPPSMCTWCFSLNHEHDKCPDSHMEPPPHPLSPTPTRHKPQTTYASPHFLFSPSPHPSAPIRLRHNGCDCAPGEAVRITSSTSAPTSIPIHRQPQAKSPLTEST